MKNLVLFVVVSILFVGCATAPRSAGTRSPMYTVTNTSTTAKKVAGIEVSSETHTSTQNFLKPRRQSSLLGLLIGEANPIPTQVPSGQSVQEGHPQPPVVVVEQPYGYPYGYGYGGYGHSGYSYARVPARSGECRQLFGVRFRVP